jgi:hypothetical protein
MVHAVYKFMDRTLKVVEIPASLKPSQGFPLIRLGSARDGGYLIDQRLTGNNLISFGISGDWRFEQDWRGVNPKCQICTYDGSISLEFFIIKFLKNILRLDNLPMIHRNFTNIIEFNSFIKGKTQFFAEFIGSQPGQSSFRSALCRMNSSEDRSLFVKIDIEGSEYDILDELVEHQQFICGLAIEFHDVSENIERICDFVDNFHLNICNSHANNCLPKNNVNNDPCIEMTFSYLDGDQQLPSVPHPLEADNDSSCEPVIIKFV